MFKSFYPSIWLDSTYVIDFESYYERGFRAVIFDIDNTLVPHGAPADDRSVELFKRLHRIGYDTLVLSNNKRPRVQSFAEAVDAKYIYKANKPFVKGYKDAMGRMNTDTSNTLFVGDQLFTDVMGAKNAGIYTILVKPIHPKEEIQIVLKRRLEAIVLFFYKKSLKKKANRT